MKRVKVQSAIVSLVIATLGACSSNGHESADASENADTSERAEAALTPSCDAASSEELEVDNSFGALHGTLTLPERCAPVPVFLIIAGSGATDRDGNSAGLQTDTYRLLAAGLAERGIASLRYDKAGVGASQAAGPGSEAAMRFEMGASDAALFLQALRADPRLSLVLVAGHSEGALLGLLAARQVPIAGYVSLAGPGRTAGAVLREQLRAQLDDATYEQVDQVITELEAGRLVSDLPPLPALAALFRPSVQPYLISWMRYEPPVELQQLSAPVAIVQGTTDLQVSTRDAELLSAARPDAQLVIVEGMNHVLKLASGSIAQQLPSYTDPTLPLVSELLDQMAAFVQP